MDFKRQAQRTLFPELTTATRCSFETAISLFALTAVMLRAFMKITPTNLHGSPLILDSSSPPIAIYINFITKTKVTLNRKAGITDTKCAVTVAIS